MNDTQERTAREGLDVRGYPGKWLKAQELAQSNQRRDNGRLLPYWERVRLLFLELGGEYSGTEYPSKF
jgi:hypothetical protein